MAEIDNRQALIYLWSRDAGFPANQETEDYVVDHLRKTRGMVIAYSDDARAQMARRIVERLDG